MEWHSSPVEDKLGIHFKNADTLCLALIHPSYAQQLNEPDHNNQRLEFLGDAILNFVITDYLYHRCPYLAVTNLQALRDKLVDPERLTSLWFQLGLGEGYPFLALKEERHRLRLKRHNPFEGGLRALVGAIHSDRGFAQARNWLTKRLIAPLLERHLKKLPERVSPDKQLKFLGESLIPALVSDYLYGYLPHVSPEQLKSLQKKLFSKERQDDYLNRLSPEELSLISPKNEAVSSNSLKVLLAAIYLQHNDSDQKGSFKKTSQWFIERFIDEEEVLKEAIALLLKEGKPQKWIIRYVMGYESKDYNQGRDRFNELISDA
jgi:ribonuclease-3